MIYPQLLKLLEHSVSFYLGCLLWATFITQNFEEPKDILDNDYYGQTIDEEKMLFEVNYIISYIDKLKKDFKYYLLKNCNLPEYWTTIMTCYKEFLIINKFLTNTHKTSDVKLPINERRLSKDELEIILEKIKEVVVSGELRNLFDVKNFIL